MGSDQEAQEMEMKGSLTVKEIAEKMNLTTYAVRYYDNAGLIPYVERTSGNIRLFSDYNLAWLKIVHCLRSTGLPVTEVPRRGFDHSRTRGSHLRTGEKTQRAIGRIASPNGSP